MRNPITALLVVCGVLFVGAMGFFYIQHGSMQEAGAEMDNVLADAADATSEAADNIGDATDDFIEDVQNGNEG